MVKKVLFVLGTRPEAIKLAPVITELNSRPQKFEITVAVTAQHREMLDQVLGLFDIEADYDLNLMTEDQNLFDVTSEALLGLQDVLTQEAPSVVLVEGDTTTVFVACLAAFYLRIPVGHVEAGLRTFDRRNPFPEEMHRRLAGALADYHFAPTGRARKNLLAEGVPDERVYVTGNTVVDALLSVIGKPSHLSEHPALSDLELEGKRILLVTVHRRESFGKPMENIYKALRDIVERNEDVEVVFPVHLNPNVRRAATAILAEVDRVSLLEPLPYLAFAHLMNRSYLILTDSGGIQEEAPSLGKPVLVLREATERPEAIEAGTALLVGTDKARIRDAAQELLDDPVKYDRMAKAVNPFGDGKAAQRIADVLEVVLREN
jgi:UDP-N-acetylglucosamine 2-epimerase (non-hydrolysing)